MAANMSTSEVVNDSVYLQDQFFLLFDNEEMSDIQLKVGERTFHSHKLVLTLHSDVFKIMLTSGNWPESRSRRIVLQEEPECVEVFEDFLKYLYSGIISLESKSVLAVLSLADKYNIKRLSASCIQFMCKNCLPESEPYLISWLQYAIMSDRKELEAQCRSYISSNFETISKSDEFLSMDANLLVAFLKDSNLVISSEFNLYMTVRIWLKAQPSARLNDYFIKTMIHIRFPMMLLAELPLLENDKFMERFKDFFLKKIMLSIRYHTCYTRDARQEIIETVNNRKIFYPRNYTQCTWGTTLNVENFSLVPNGDVIGAYFNTPTSMSEKNHHDVTDWHLHLYPKGIRYERGMMIGADSNRTVEAKYLRNVRLSVSGTFTEQIRVEICVLILIDRDEESDDHFVLESVRRCAIFDKDHSMFNIDNLVPFQKLNHRLSPYLSGKDRFRLSVFIKPEYDHLN